MTKIICFGEIPLTVTTELKPPDVVEAGVDEFDVISIERETRDF